MKLSKTQQKLFDAAKADGRVSVELVWGRGPEGGRISMGSREFDAAKKLVQAGLLEEVNRITSSTPNGGYTIHNTIVRLQPKAHVMTQASHNDELFVEPKDLEGYLFRIVDNGGSSADRYTVVFSDGSYLALSSHPSHPQGVSISGDEIDPAVLQEWVETGRAVDLALGDLPERLVQHILSRNNQGFADFLAAVEAKAPPAVAIDRAGAEINDGIADSGCKGIYVTEEGYRIRLDGEPAEDRGPYQTARKAVLASLPDQYGLAGEEYHSSVDVMRLTPDEDVLARVAALEAKVDAEWRAGQAGEVSPAAPDATPDTAPDMAP
jgi:hypothetical protein